MEEATLYNLLNRELLRKWRDTIEKTESETYFFAEERKALKELEAELNEKSKGLLTSYSLAIENRLDDLHYLLKIKILNLGIKIGMDLQKSFAEFED